MKRIIYLFTAVSLIFLIVVLSNGCKKNENTAPANDSYEQVKSRAQQATLERYGRVGARMVIPINEKAQSVWHTNAQGERMIVPPMNPSDGICGVYTCATVRNFGLLYEVYTMEHIKWVYHCTNGNSLTASWLVSVPYNLLLQHPNTSAYSYGEIRIMNGGTLIAASPNLGNGNLAIQSLGTDPGCSSNNYYRVTYTWSGVSDSYFPGNRVDAQFTVYNNCNSIYINYNSTATWTQGSPHAASIMDVFTHPCDRIDMPFTNHNTGGPGNCSSVAGEYGGSCSVPSGWTAPAGHQVEYRAVNNFYGPTDEWYDQNSTIYVPKAIGSGSPGTDVIPVSIAGVAELRNMVPSSGKWVVRYRNVVTSTCGVISAPSPWPIWFEEVWTL